jgi:hypothetical protein
MFNDLVNQTTQARIITNAWAANKDRITAKVTDLDSLVAVGKFSYEFIFASRNYIKNLEEYLKVPSKYFEPFSGEFDKCKAICKELSEIEKAATKVWKDVAPRIKAELPPTEWEKYLAHLDTTSGSTKYARDLGWLLHT